MLVVVVVMLACSACSACSACGTVHVVLYIYVRSTVHVVLYVWHCMHVSYMYVLRVLYIVLRTYVYIGILSFAVSTNHSEVEW